MRHVLLQVSAASLPPPHPLHSPPLPPPEQCQQRTLRGRVIIPILRMTPLDVCVAASAQRHRSAARVLPGFRRKFACEFLLVCVHLCSFAASAI